MPIKFDREVTPDQPRIIYTIIRHDSGELFLSSDEVTLLREKLTTWDENELPPGTRYIISIELKNGDIIPRWQPSHDG